MELRPPPLASLKTAVAENSLWSFYRLTLEYSI
jgi:hypothetical protein